jgi:hypothetical protein
MKTDNKGNALIPGRVYCMVEIKEDSETGETWDSYGPLAWYGSDGELYDANYDDCEGDVISHWNYDYLVLQVGDVNPKYVFPVSA